VLVVSKCWVVRCLRACRTIVWREFLSRRTSTVIRIVDVNYVEIGVVDCWCLTFQAHLATLGGSHESFVVQGSFGNVEEGVYE